MARDVSPLRRTAVLAVALLLMQVGACASGGDARPPDPNQPQESPSVALTHNAKPSINTREVDADGFSIAVPAKFEEKTEPGPAGTTNYVWALPESGGQPPYVGVVTDPEPQVGALEQTKTLELSLEADGESEVIRSTLKWPGVQQAILLQWEQRTAGTGDVTTNWQLVTTVEGGTIYSVVAQAPRRQFDALGLAEVIATFTPSS